MHPICSVLHSYKVKLLSPWPRVFVLEPSTLLVHPRVLNYGGKEKLEKEKKMLILKASSKKKPAGGIVCEPGVLPHAFPAQQGRASLPRRAIKPPPCCLRSLLRMLMGNNTNNSQRLQTEGSGREQLNEQLGPTVARAYIVL